MEVARPFATLVSYHNTIQCYEPEDLDFIINFTRGPSLDPVPSHINQAYTLKTYFFKVHFNTVHPSISRSSKCIVPFRFSN